MVEVMSRIDGPLGLPRVDAPSTPTTQGADGIDFRRLLESFEKLSAAQKQAPPVENVEGLQEAMQRADQGFVTAMDLRRQLEAAFQARQS